jgi:hypothetical protein
MPYKDILTEDAFERKLPQLRAAVLAELQKRGVSIPHGYRFESVSGGVRNEDVRLVTYSRPRDPEAFMTLSCTGSEATGYVMTDLLMAQDGGKPRRAHTGIPLPRPEEHYDGPERRV